MGSGPAQIGGGCRRSRPERVGRYSIKAVAATTRTKPPSRGTKQKSGRRLPPKVKRGPDVPLLPVVVGGVLVVAAIVLIVITVISNRSSAPPMAGPIPCDKLEHTQTHYHAALQIMYQGNLVNIPGDVGRPSSCLYWLHMHTESPGVIHIESPRNRTFTLGEFFEVWSKSKGKPEPLDSTHVSTLTLTGDEKLVVYVDAGDGKGPQLFTGDPKTIVLQNHEVITLEITPPTTTPPPSFTFPNGL